MAEMCKAVLRTGWRGPWSVEVFDGERWVEGREYGEGEMAGWCRQAMGSVRELFGECADCEWLVWI